MSKKISDTERLLGYAMTRTEPELQNAISIFRTALANRFPRKPARKAATPKQPAAPKSIDTPKSE